MLRQDTITTPTRLLAATGSRDPVRPLVVAVIILAIATIGLAAILLAPSVTTTAGEALADDVVAAWNGPDGPGIRDLYTDDAIVWTSDSAEPAAIGVEEIAVLAQYGGFTIERIGAVSERGNLVSYPAHVSTNYDVSGSDAVVVLYLRDGRIAQHWVIWDELE